MDSVPPPPPEAFGEMDINGETYMVPKGLYYTQQKDISVDAAMKTPNVADIADTIRHFGGLNANLQKENDIAAGIYLPMPFGMQPLSFQLMSKISDDESRNMKIGLHGNSENESEDDQGEEWQRPTSDPPVPTQTRKTSGMEEDSSLLDRLVRNFGRLAKRYLKENKAKPASNKVLRFNSSSRTQNEAYIYISIPGFNPICVKGHLGRLENF
ncbi:unnamed protein product [Soboliphyme baturini]|uniref:Uncharacterized protein n=1 Tax=Soboliphyme baturini TaxID=241478 RepID=A0A183IS28_9BILA|nr:unnamed protein product [Soboliphyme baturini]